MSKYDNFLKDRLKTFSHHFTLSNLKRDKVFLNSYMEEYNLSKVDLPITTLFMLDYESIFQDLMYMLGTNESKIKNFKKTKVIFNSSHLNRLKKIKENPDSSYYLGLYSEDKHAYSSNTFLFFTLENERLNLTLVKETSNICYSDAKDKFKYSVLLHVAANVLDLKPGKFVQFTNRLYIETSQIKLFKKLMARNPVASGNLDFKILKNFDDFKDVTLDSFNLKNYNTNLGNFNFEVQLRKKYFKNENAHK